MSRKNIRDDITVLGPPTDQDAMYQYTLVKDERLIAIVSVPAYMVANGYDITVAEALDDLADAWEGAAYKEMRHDNGVKH